MTQADNPKSVQQGAPKRAARARQERERTERPDQSADEAIALTQADVWSRASQVAVIGIFVIALLWCAYVAQPVLVPVLLAWVIATIVLPIVQWMQDRGMPRVLAVIIVTFVLVALIIGLLALLSTPLTYWIGRAAELGALLKQKFQSMNQPLALLEEARKALNAIEVGGNPPALKVEQSATVVTTIFSVLTPAVSQFILFIGALVFYLVYQKRIRNTVVFLLQDHEARLLTLRMLREIDENMTTYFGTFTIVNFCLGVATAGLTWVVGLPNPLLWGVLAGVFNYVPYIGPAIVIGTLALVGLLSFPTLGAAMIMPLIYIAIVTLEGQFLTPAIMGSRLELNPFAVFLAIAFCTWLWGPVGAFLAVPVLMALSVALGHVFAEEKPDLPE
jgi:predicted PurR-regulated permease PerM